MLSLTSIFTKVLAVFPFTSVTLKVTTLFPISLHVKSDFDRLKLAISQLSLDPLSKSFGFTLTTPLSSN